MLCCCRVRITLSSGRSLPRAPVNNRGIDIMFIVCVSGRDESVIRRDASRVSKASKEACNYLISVRFAALVSAPRVNTFASQTHGCIAAGPSKRLMLPRCRWSCNARSDRTRFEHDLQSKSSGAHATCRSNVSAYLLYGWKVALILTVVNSVAGY